MTYADHRHPGGGGLMKRSEDERHQLGRCNEDDCGG